MIYKDGPAFNHSQYSVIVTVKGPKEPSCDKLTWLQLAALKRVNANCGKVLASIILRGWQTITQKPKVSKFEANMSSSLPTGSMKLYHTTKIVVVLYIVAGPFIYFFIN